MSDLREVLSQAVSPVLPPDVDLEELEIAKAGRRQVVRVVIDRDGGIDLDLIAAVSQQVSEILDVPDFADALGDSYTLEVTSPGIDRPLTIARHWQRNVSRLVVAERVEGASVTGRIVSADEERVILQPTKGDAVELPYADLLRGTVQIEFNRVEAE